jgi:protein-L-isoaspartate(D-aspartate) O-methyltransferase
LAYVNKNGYSGILAMASSDVKDREISEAESLRARRHEMVAHSIAARGVRDKLVLDAMRKVPRELFVPGKLREFAYEDAPLPIPDEQTISQPYIVAFMAEALLLKGGEKVMEIGAGSGYAPRCSRKSLRTSIPLSA